MSVGNDLTSLQNERRKNPLCSCVRISLERYFRDLDGHKPGNMYQMVLEEIEKPLLEAVLGHTKGNQTKAAEILGITRSTLRKKLDHHNLT